MTTNTTADQDEHYFIALANDALGAGDVRGARGIAAQFASARRADRRLRRAARRHHTA